MLEVMEPLALKFGDTPNIGIGCNRLQPIGKFGVSTVLACNSQNLVKSSLCKPGFDVVCQAG